MSKLTARGFQKIEKDRLIKLILENAQFKEHDETREEGSSKKKKGNSSAIKKETFELIERFQRKSNKQKSKQKTIALGRETKVQVKDVLKEENDVLATKTKEAY